MGTFTSLLSSWLDDRSSGIFWRYFVGSFLVWNWQIPYILFFESFANDAVVRSVYVTHLYIHDAFLPGFLSLFVYLACLPLATTYLLISPFQRIVNFFYESAIGFEFQRKRIRLDKLIELQDLKNELEKKRLSLESAKTEIQSERMDVQQKEQAEWEKDLQEFLKGGKLGRFQDAISTHYHLSRDALSVTDTKTGEIALSALSFGLLENENGEMRLTRKGQYFLKRASTMSFVG